MLSRTSVKTPKNQKGVALLIMIVVIVLAFSSYFIAGLSINQVRVDQQEKVRKALKRAKESMIAYAITFSDRVGDGRFGFLPCPDYTNALTEGVQDGNCAVTNQNIVGWFPWREMNINIPHDQVSCLLYAVTGSYKQSPQTSTLNGDANGMFQVVDSSNNVIVGNNPEDRIVAIVFSPGTSLGAQVRNFDATSSCGKDYGNISAYLDSNGVTDNATLVAAADSIDQFIHGTSTSEDGANPYNDQFITIKRSEIWSAITSRRDFQEKMQTLTGALATCLSDYSVSTGIKRLPWVAPIVLADYRDEANYDDSDGTIEYSGRVPYSVGDSNAKMALAGSTDLFDYASCDYPALLISTSYLVNNAANYAIGDRVIAVDTGTRIVLAGDTVEFAGDANLYTVDTILRDGVISIAAPGLLQSLNDNTAVTVKRDVDLTLINGEYRKLWENWKDHFFYVVSEDFEMDDLAEAVGLIKSTIDLLNAASIAILADDTLAAQATADDAVDESTIAVAAANAAVTIANNLIAAAGNADELEVANSEASSAADVLAEANAILTASTSMQTIAYNPLPSNLYNPGHETLANNHLNDAIAAVAAALIAAEPVCLPNTLPSDEPINCIKVDASPSAVAPSERAGVVIFSGSAQAGQIRNGPVAAGDVNTKGQAVNYLENNNAVLFPDTDGNGYYETAGAASNDIMYCIETDLSVIECL